MTARSRQWQVLQQGEPVRSAPSLVDLLQLPTAADVSAALWRELELIDPFFAPFDHPLLHLSNCATAARQVAEASTWRLTSPQVDAVVEVYEAGLLAGYDGIDTIIMHEPQEGLAASDLARAYQAAQRHGEGIRQRWRAYENLISILLGGKRPC